MHSARGLLEWWVPDSVNLESRGGIAEMSHRRATGKHRHSRAQKGRGDVRFAEGRIRFGGGYGPATYVATLAAVLVLAVALLLVFPVKALAAADLTIEKQG